MNYYDPLEAQVQDEDFRALVNRVSMTEGVDPALARAVVDVESEWKPRAVSSAGASGLMQLMPATAKAYGVEDIFNPEQNVTAGVKHLKVLLDRYDDVGLSLAAYNAGEGAVDKYGGIPPFPETQAYVPKVMARYQPEPYDPLEVDSGGSVAAGPGGFYDPLEAPAPAEEGRPGLVSNLARGIGEEAVRLGGGMLDFIDSTREIAKKTVPGKVAVELQDLLIPGMRPLARLAPFGDGKTLLQKGADEARAVSFGYQPMMPWEEVKENWKDDSVGALEFTGNLLGFGAEQFVVSTPHMAGVLFGLPAYVVARTGQLSMARAKADEREEVHEGDLAVGLLTATTSAFVERYGVDKLLKGLRGGMGVPEGSGLIRKTLEVLKGIVKHGGVESATEAIQEAVEYIGVTAGTVQGFDEKQLADQMLAGAVGGAVPGGAFGGVGGFQNARRVRGEEFKPEDVADESEVIAAELNDLEDKKAALADALAAGDEKAVNLVKKAEEIKRLFLKEPGLKPGDFDFKGTVLEGDATGAARPKFEIAGRGFTRNYRILEEGDKFKDELTKDDIEEGVTAVGWMDERVQAKIDRAPEGSFKEQLKSYQETAVERKNISEDLRVWQKRFAPGMKIVLDFVGEENNRKNNGYAIYDKDIDASVIYVNPTIFQESLGVASARETASHEFGHSLMVWSFRNSNDKVKLAVFRDYAKWLSQSMDMAASEYQGTKTPMVRALGERAPDLSDPSYSFSFDEWFADQVARFIAGDKTEYNRLDESSRGVIARIAVKLKKLYEDWRQQFRSSTSIELWLRGLSSGRGSDVFGKAIAPVSPTAASNLTDADGKPIPLNKLHKNMGHVIARIEKGESLEDIEKDAKVKRGLPSLKDYYDGVLEAVREFRGGGYRLGVMGYNRLGLSPDKMYPESAALAKAWHVGPNPWAAEPGFPFGRPNLEFQGSGEGGQLFGWGFYTAEHEGTRDSYVGAFSGEEDVTFRGERINPNKGPLNAVHSGDSPELVAAYALRSNRVNRADAIADLLGLQADWDRKIERTNELIAEGKGNPQTLLTNRDLLLDRLKVAEEAEEELRSGRVRPEEVVLTAKPAQVYRLDIPDADIKRMLLWDKPLSEQTKEVREALKKAGGAVQETFERDPQITGETLYMGLMDTLPNVPNEHPKKKASDYLNSLGIVGNKFVDQGTRFGYSEGETFNYVIWNQDVLNRTLMLDKETDQPLDVFGPSLSKALDLDEDMEPHLRSLLSALKTAEAKWRWYDKWLKTPLQLRDKFNALVPELKSWIGLNDAAYNIKSKILMPADEITDEWMHLPRDQAALLSDLLFRVTAWSDREQAALGVKLAGTDKMDPRFIKLLAESELNVGSKATADTIALWEKLDGWFRSTVDQAKEALVYELADRFSGLVKVNGKQIPLTGEQVLAALETYGKSAETTNALFGVADFMDQGDTIGFKFALDEILDKTDVMEGRNFFPYSRFGRFTTTIRMSGQGVFEGKKVKDGKQLAFLTYESKRARDKDLARLRKEIESRTNGKLAIDVSEMHEDEFTMMAMPWAAIDRVVKDMGLDPQKDQDKIRRLREKAIARHPGMGFLKHMMKRKGVYGFSEDAIRVFSDYAIGASNHIARIRYLPQMKRVSDQIHKRVTAEATRTDIPFTDSSTLAGIDAYVKDHLKELTQPKNDFAKIRALAFVWYLGFNVKSAAVNLTQVPLVTYPKLANDFSDPAATKAILAALSKVNRILRKPEEIKRLSKKTQYWQDIEELIRRGLDEGWLDESYATNVAGLADSMAINEFSPISFKTSTLGQFTSAAAMMFHTAESFNRRVTAVAAFDLYRKKNPKSSIDEAADYAKEIVRSTQFEYAKWNRPKFMRGAAAVPTIFMSYMQHYLYSAFGGHGGGTAGRMWLLMGLVAGLEGLPLFGHGMDLVDLISRVYSKMFGGSPITVRKEAKKMVEELLPELDSAPQIALHGFGSRYGLGMLHMIDGASGSIIPNTDVSGSLSAGFLNRGLEEMMSQERDPEKQFARMVVGALGPAAAMFYNAWGAWHSNEPDFFKRMERVYPVFMKNAARAGRWWDQGYADVGRNLSPFKPMNDGWEGNLTASALGFPVSDMTNYWDVNSMTREQETYWDGRRNSLLWTYRKAVFSKDKDWKEKTLERIKRFNKDAREAGLPKALIGRDNLKQSLSRGAEDRMRKSRGLPNKPMYAPLYVDVKEAMGG